MEICKESLLLGYPQEDVIEVHGSWYDPANPVICYEGTLRRDVFSRMKEAKYSADLVLVIGTSLSGLNSERVAVSTARRSLEASSPAWAQSSSTSSRSAVTSLRIFSLADRELEALLARLAARPQERAAVP